MKAFSRFAHEGVLKDLERLKDTLQERGQYEFGSSGDGELTARRNGVTSYARRYRSGEREWRLEVCSGGESLLRAYPESFEDVIGAILRFER